MKISKPNFNYGIDAFDEIFDWARTMAPRNVPEEEIDTCLTRLATKGGITEAMVDSIHSGANLREAIDSGIERSIAISKDINNVVTSK